MAGWREAIQHRIERDDGARRTAIYNWEWYQEYGDLIFRSSHPEAGSIQYDFSTDLSTVTNSHTFATLTDLSLDSVEQALQALNVADGDYWQEKGNIS